MENMLDETVYRFLNTKTVVSNLEPVCTLQIRDLHSLAKKEGVEETTKAKDQEEARFVTA